MGTALSASQGGSATGAVAVLLAAAAWGSTGTAAHFAPAWVGSASIGAARIVLGGAVLLALAARPGQRAGIHRPDQPPDRRARADPALADRHRGHGGAVRQGRYPARSGAGRHLGELATHRPGLAVTAYLGLVTTVAAYLLYGRGLRKLSARWR